MRLALLFLSCLSLLCFFPVYVPSVHLFFFLPFFVAILAQGNLLLCLAAAFGCGLVMDLLSSYVRLGIHPAAYACSMGLLWWICRFFFFEIRNLAATAFMGMLLSCVSTVFLLAIGWCMGQMWHIEPLGWLKGVLGYSLLDGLYAAACLHLYRAIGKQSEPVFA